MNKTEFIENAEKVRKAVVENAIMDTSKELKAFIYSGKATKFLTYFETGQLNELGTFNRVLKEALKENERGAKGLILLDFRKDVIDISFQFDGKWRFDFIIE